MDALFIYKKDDGAFKFQHCIYFVFDMIRHDKMYNLHGIGSV